MNFFLEIFIKKNFLRVVFFIVFSILGNLAYVSLMAKFAGEHSLIIEMFGGLNTFQVPLMMYIIIFLYAICFTLSFYLQVYLANQFSIDLNLDMDNLLGVSIFKENQNLSQALVIKDISSEFARFGNNVILPITEIVKSFVGFTIIIVAVILSEPILIFPCILLFLFYSGFWLFTKNYFMKIASKISSLLLERQRYAEFKYQNFNELNSKTNKSQIQIEFEKVLHTIAELNVISKTISILPRIIIETFLLISLILFVYHIGEKSIILFGLAGLKLAISAQAISNGISNLQLNWPAFLEYQERRALYKKFSESEHQPRSYQFPTLIPEGNYFVKSLKLEFSVNENINLRPHKICLLRGPSGIGKSTFLNLLCGFHEADIFTKETFIKGNNDVFILGQNTQILTGTVKENLYLNCPTNKVDEKLLYDLYEVFFGFKTTNKKEELSLFLEQHIGVNFGVSGGEARRVRLMASLLSPAALHLWDEPFDGIHPTRVFKIVEYLAELKNRKFMIIDHNLLSTESVSCVISFQRDDKDRISVSLSERG